MAACTPGFWKNHLESWVDFTPDQTVGSVFTGADLVGLGGITLLEALEAGGGAGVEGAAQILLRAAVAALLNSTSDTGFPLATAEIISEVNAALATGDRSVILALATRLDELNNTGECSLS